jgi:hypothetical protein
MIAFETQVQIDRSIEEVFAYVSDPLNFPHWNSAVEAVGKTPAGDNGVSSTYVMARELPTGRAVNELEIVANKPPSELVIRAVAGPTPFLYRYRFAAANDVTVMQLNAEVELPGAAAFLPQLARRLIKKGVFSWSPVARRCRALAGPSQRSSSPSSSRPASSSRRSLSTRASPHRNTASRPFPSASKSRRRPPGSSMPSAAGTAV